MMSPLRLKQILAVALLGAVAAIWIPPLLESSSNVPPAALHGAAADGGDPEDPGDGLVETEGGASARTPASDSDLETLGDMLRLLRGRFDRGGSASGPPQERTLASVPIEPEFRVEILGEEHGGPTLLVPQPRRRAEIDAFLAEHPLRATLVGQSSSRALLGSRVVTAGEELLEGALRVEAIRAHSVVLHVEGRPQVLTLPAFQARAKDDPLSDAEPVEDPLDGLPPERGVTPKLEEQP